MKSIQLFTDGACSGNPGPGAYGAILCCESHRKELSGGYKNTTNNRMEIMGVIAGLMALKEPCAVTITTDSQYVVNAISKGWAKKWRSNGWKRNKNEPALNSDLWAKLLDLCDIHTITMVWVRGHAGHAENERCDELAVAAIRNPPLLDDIKT